MHGKMQRYRSKMAKLTAKTDSSTGHEDFRNVVLQFHKVDYEGSNYAARGLNEN